MKFILALMLFPVFSFADTVKMCPDCDDGIVLLKDGCANPARYHNQIPPVDIKIHCEDTRIEWVYVDDQSGTFSNHRKMCISAVTNKPNIRAGKLCFPCNHPDSPYKCGSWKEVCKTVDMTFAVTCEQVMGMRSIGDFCLQLLDKEVTATDEKILEVKDTGKTKSVCGVKDLMNGKPVEEKASIK